MLKKIKYNQCNLLIAVALLMFIAGCQNQSYLGQVIDKESGKIVFESQYDTLDHCQKVIEKKINELSGSAGGLCDCTAPGCNDGIEFE